MVNKLGIIVRIINMSVYYIIIMIIKYYEIDVCVRWENGNDMNGWMGMVEEGKYI